MHLSEMNWLFINNLTYKIHEIMNFDEMRHEFLESLNLVVQFDRAAFYLADRTQNISLCDPVGVNFTEEQFDLYLFNHYRFDNFKSMISSTNSVVYRSSDVFTADEFESSKYYNEAYKPLDIYYSTFMAIIYKDEFLGSVSLYRSKEKEDFSDKDIYVLERLKEHLALRLSKQMGFYDLQAPNEYENQAMKSLCSEKGLTDREIEVVQHLFKGDTTKEICDELHIAPTTLKKHITNSYRKLNIGCRAQLYKMLK